MEKKVKDRFDVSTTRGRILAWLHAFFVEHNFVNIFRRNFHKLSDKAYRSSQPTMYQLRGIVRKYGIRTVVNLKGENRNSGYFLLERQACKKLGVAMVNHTIYSRKMPDRNTIKKARSMLEGVDYPILLHCKAGADRVGIISTLYQYFMENLSMEASIRELRFWPYGHIRYAKAGKMDFFFDEFIKYKNTHPDQKIELEEWSENIMDKEDLEKRFVKHPWADILYDYILKRQ
jgi:protein tyrosine/serine phosphatase